MSEAIRFRVIDFETNGLAPPDEVVEVGFCDVLQGPNGWRVMAPCASFRHCARLKPEVRAIHHIAQFELSGSPPFDAVALLTEAIADGVSAIVAHNLAFEEQWLPPMRDGAGELLRICTYKSALRVWPQAPGHSNQALRYWLEDQDVIGVDLDPTWAQPPHRAGPDAYVTAHVLRALLDQATGRQMVAWTREPALLPTCPIGKFRGKPWPDVNGGFLTWMVRNQEMEEDLRWNARRELDRRRLEHA